jgi:hypothetical protein
MGVLAGWAISYGRGTPVRPYEEALFNERGTPVLLGVYASGSKRRDAFSASSHPCDGELEKEETATSFEGTCELDPRDTFRAAPPSEV